MNLFGRKKKATPNKIDPEAISKATMQLKQNLDTLEKRQQLLYKRIDQQVAEAKRKSKAKDKKGALFCLKRKKMYEKEVAKIDGARLNIEQQVIALESSMTSVAVVDSMKVGRDTLNSIHKTVTVEDTDELMDDINEELAAADEISNAVSQPIGGDMFDEDDLMTELDDLEGLMMEEDMMNVPSISSVTTGTGIASGATKATNATATPSLNLPSAPSVPIAVTETDEEAELRALEAEFA